MEENPGTDAPLPDGTCIHCKTRPSLESSPSKLCSECREGFIKHPIPKWLYAFSAVIAVLMLISIYNMPRFLQTTMHLHRAQKALDAHKYRTAVKEAEQVLARYPANIQANAALVIASSYNLDVLKLTQGYTALVNVSIEDNALYEEVTNAMTRMNAYFPDDTLAYNAITNFQTDSAQVLKSFMDSIGSKHELETCSLFKLADRFYDLKAFDIAESVLQSLIKRDNNHVGGLHLMAATKRNLKKYDEAIAICGYLLEINREDEAAFCQEAKIEMKRHNDAQAEVYLESAAAIDQKDIVFLETSAVLQYLTGRVAESRSTLEKIKLTEPEAEKSEVYNRAYKVIYNQEKYR